MSSYLTFYGIPQKNEENSATENVNVTQKPIKIVRFSRNNDIYNYFYENCNIAFCYNGKFSDITQSDVDAVESDIMNDIRSSEKRLNEYEKYAGNNLDYVSEILSVKEYLEDLYRTLHYVEFIGYIVREASFKKIVANIG